MYNTAAQIEASMVTLEAQFPQYYTRIALPEPSVEGRAIHALRLRHGDLEDRRGVLFIGGTHARELMNPDAVLELAVELMVSHSTNSDLVYGSKVWSATEIQHVVDLLDLWFVPCINPDGRNHVMTVDDMWRKNRRDNPGTSCDGVDLNRNLDFLWAVLEGAVSCSPCSDTYCGPAALSEPEVRNVAHLLDTHGIDCCVDVHSYSELVLYPWGHAPTQTTDASQRFTTLPTGTCAPIGSPGYEEYMVPRDLLRHQTVAQRVVDAIADVRGRVYTPEPSFGLYATTGTFTDYVYGRHIADPARRKVYSFTFETGPASDTAENSFHPPDPTDIKTDAKSGLVALAQQCICAIDLIGWTLFGDTTRLAALRSVRDDRLASTEAGRDWIALFDRLQGPVAQALAADEQLIDEGGELIRTSLALIEREDRIAADDIARGSRFLDVLDSRATSDADRADLAAVAEVAFGLEGSRADEVIAGLMASGPGPPARD